MALKIKQASKKQKKTKALFYGLSGAGKTYTSIELAIALARGNKVLVLDTENGNSELYSSVFDFEVAVLEAPFSLDSLVSNFKEAEAYVGENGVIIVDTLSKFWDGAGGALEEVNKSTGGNKQKTMDAWGAIAPKINKVKETLFSSKTAHVIVTARCKSETIMEEYTTYDGKTKTRAVKVGLQAIWRDGLEYEADFSLVFELNTNKDGTDSQVIRNTKPPRCDYFKEFERSVDGRIGQKWDTQEVAQNLLFWLEEGENPMIVKLKDAVTTWMNKYVDSTGTEHPDRVKLVELNDELSIRALGKSVKEQVLLLEQSQEEIPV